jgi:tetratricopeptide (TPR) repeat protein
LAEAAERYEQARGLLPADALTERAITHGQLGTLHGELADGTGTALAHYQQALRYCEQTGNRYSAGHTRFNIALALARAGRVPDALAYARAALRDYDQVGPGATADVDKARQLIADLEQDGGLS